MWCGRHVTCTARGPVLLTRPSFTGSGPWQAVAGCTPLERGRFGRTHPAQRAAALLEQSARPAPGPLRCLRVTPVRRGAGRAATAWRPTLRPSWRPSRPSAHSSRCSSPRWCTRPRACTPGCPGPLSRPRALSGPRVRLARARGSSESGALGASAAGATGSLVEVIGGDAS